MAMKGGKKGMMASKKAKAGAMKMMQMPAGDVVVSMPKKGKAVAPKAGYGMAHKAGKAGKKKGK